MSTQKRKLSNVRMLKSKGIPINSSLNHLRRIQNIRAKQAINLANHLSANTVAEEIENKNESDSTTTTGSE